MTAELACGRATTTVRGATTTVRDETTIVELWNPRAPQASAGTVPARIRTMAKTAQMSVFTANPLVANSHSIYRLIERDRLTQKKHPQPKTSSELRIIFGRVHHSLPKKELKRTRDLPPTGCSL